MNESNTTNERKRWILHITHNDSDAVGCDVILRLLFEHPRDINNQEKFVVTKFCANNKVDDIIASCINQLDPSNIDTHGFLDKTYHVRDLIAIYVTDIVIKQESYANLYEFVHNILYEYGCNIKDIIYVDHHNSNSLSPINDKDINSDTKLSSFVVSNTLGGKPVAATKLLYERQKLGLTGFPPPIIGIETQLYKLHRFNRFIDDINRYDTWLWKNEPRMTKEGEIDPEPTEYYTTSLINLVGIESTIDIILKHITTDDTGDEFYIPKQIVDVIKLNHEANLNKAIRGLSHKLHMTVDREYVVGMLIEDGSNMFSELSDYIEQRYPNVFDYLQILYVPTMTISLRTKSPNVDVSKIASRLHGGGGHVKAAGYHISEGEVISYLSEYWNCPDMSKFEEDQPDNVYNWATDLMTNNKFKDGLKYDPDKPIRVYRRY